MCTACNILVDIGLHIELSTHEGGRRACPCSHRSGRACKLQARKRGVISARWLQHAAACCHKRGPASKRDSAGTNESSAHSAGLQAPAEKRKQGKLTAVLPGGAGCREGGVQQLQCSGQEMQRVDRLSAAWKGCRSISAVMGCVLSCSLTRGAGRLVLAVTGLAGLASCRHTTWCAPF